MKVSPSVKEVDGKNKSSLFINQGGNALKHAYTRENPNGMPDMEQITVNGVLIWDDTKRLAFLHNMVTTQILPKLPGTQSADAKTAPAVDPAQPQEVPLPQELPLPTQGQEDF